MTVHSTGRAMNRATSSGFMMASVLGRDFGENQHQHGHENRRNDRTPRRFQHLFDRSGRHGGGADIEHVLQQQDGADHLFLVGQQAVDDARRTVAVALQLVHPSARSGGQRGFTGAEQGRIWPGCRAGSATGPAGRESVRYASVVSQTVCAAGAAPSRIRNSYTESRATFLADEGAADTGHQHEGQVSAFGLLVVAHMGEKAAGVEGAYCGYRSCASADRRGAMAAMARSASSSLHSPLRAL